ncbi:MAG TPA: DUF6516 family protein [Xanthobacteraceae bacterium]|jgi:hypothetical protein|nr:DUF6516 family protein [Xanthobacteraceae bacterium]
MKAELLYRQRSPVGEHAFAELAIWRLPRQLPGSAHSLKYRLALVVRGVCVLRYDNEAHKGDHRHIGSEETAYAFTTVDQLLADFWADVDAWENRYEDG